ncbi:glycosyltransferase [Sphingobium amiense]|nr:glycosyltransferase [Sphingobium amiense]
MPAFSPDGFPSSEDLSFLYRIALGREPVSAEVEAGLCRPMAKSVPALFQSAEFRSLRSRVVRRLPIEGGSYDVAPDESLAGWAAYFFPLTMTTREQVRGAGDWAQLFELLFCDRRFRRRIAREWRGLSMRAFIAGLKALRKSSAHVIGAVESWSGSDVIGWAVDRRDPDKPLLVELHLNGRFIAAARTGTRPHRMGEGWGGRGLVGFQMRITPEALEGRKGLAEVREASTGLVIGRFETHDFRSPPLDAIAQVRGELTRLRSLLDSIEGKLPGFNMALGYSIESYDDYFRAYYAPVHRAIAPGASRLDMCVLVDATHASARELEQTLVSLAGQESRPAQIAVIYSGNDLKLELEMTIDVARRQQASTEIIARLTGTGGKADAINALVAANNAEHMLLLPAGCCLTPDAVSIFATALNSATMAYSDSDRLEGEPWLIGPRHIDPSFRSVFDRTLNLQQDQCGPVLAIRRDHLMVHSMRSAFNNALGLDLVLRSAEAGAQLRHIPRVLYHLNSATGELSLEDRLAVVRDHLARVEPQVAASPLEDILKAPTQALRVHWPVGSGTKAAIIIPTRDRLDLLMPCLGSIEASLPNNQVELQLIIVNNRSEAQETKDFLARAARMPQVQVIDHDGAFNWAAMNNRAVEGIDADVFIFLNNDTVVLSPDCWDELCSQALRKEVGAVGARLLYEDGTVQHAGVVMDEWHSFASHEGVGDASTDPGYLDRHLLVREVSMVTGACLATRSEIFREAGGFDVATFPVEGNDTDYCLRLRSMGLKILYDGQACLYHFESRSRGYNDDEAKQRRAFIATQALRERWAKQFERDPYYNPHFDRLAPAFKRLQAPRPVSFHNGHVLAANGRVGGER